MLVQFKISTVGDSQFIVDFIFCSRFDCIPSHGLVRAQRCRLVLCQVDPIVKGEFWVNSHLACS